MTKYDKNWFDVLGFDKVWFHRVTHDEYDPNWFDVLGFNKDNFNKEWYNKKGFNRNWYNPEWYNFEWYNKSWYDKDWFNKNWKNLDWYDKDWYDKNWYDKYSLNKEWYNINWYDIDWYNKDWFNENWINSYTNTKFDKEWFDKKWFRKCWFNIDWFNIDWFNENWYDENWYDKDWYNKDWYDVDWYDTDKIDKNWYNVEWYPIKFWKITEEWYRKIRAFIKRSDLNSFYNVIPDFYKVFNNWKYNYIYNNNLISSLWFDNIYDEDNDNILSRFIVVKNNDKYNILIIYSEDPTWISHYDNSDEYNFTYKEIAKFWDEVVKENIPNFNIIRNTNYTNEIIDSKVWKLVYNTWLDEIVEYKDWGSFFTCIWILDWKKNNLDLDIYKHINNWIWEFKKDISDESKYNKIAEVEDNISKVYQEIDDEHLYNLNNWYKEKTYLDDYEEQYEENN